MELIYLQNDLEKFLRQFGLKEGSTVLLQADLSKEVILGDYSALIEAILSVIGKKGLLIVPGFTLSALDPASSYVSWPLDQHERIREYHPGFSSKMMDSDVYRDLGSALMLHTKAHRSEHPVFSFFWLGNTSCKPLIEDFDYPLSYRHILKSMEKKDAVNLLINIPLDQAIYPLLEARELKEDTVESLSCFYRRVKKSFKTTFLSSFLDDYSLGRILDRFNIKQESLGKLQFTSLSLKTAREEE